MMRQIDRQATMRPSTDRLGRDDIRQMRAATHISVVADKTSPGRMASTGAASKSAARCQ
jgi:hypothetical protein